MSCNEKRPGWTEQQMTAIEARGGNLLVAAAAGAGKTATLVERVLSRITDPDGPVDLDRLLVVTFTNAAAAEMKDRIGRALESELDALPSSRQLLRQLALLPRASITTIHSFCLEVLRQKFYRLELDPGFRVADATEAALLQAEAMDELFEGLYETGDESFINLVDCYGGERDDSILRELLLRLYHFSRSHPQPEQWLTEAGSCFGEEEGINRYPWGNELLRDIIVELAGARDDLEKALAAARQPNGPLVYTPVLEAELSMVEEAIEACRESWDSGYRSFEHFDFTRLKPAQKADPGLRQQAQRLRKTARERVSRVGDTFFSRTEQEWLEDLQRVGPLMSSLVSLVARFAEIFKRVKASRNLVDFSDLEHLCLEVLRGTGDYRDRFAEVLVDEYQDINPVQEAILDLVSRPDNRFMVGDVKQSIYRFRLAEPGLFLKKYQDYPTRPGKSARRIDLSLNFRSRRPIIQGINFLFRRIMTHYHGEMEYDEGSQLACGADYPPEDEDTGKGIELRIIGPDRTVDGDGRESGDGEEPGPEGPQEEAAEENGEPSEEMEDLETAQVEARWIIQRIRQMINVNHRESFRVYDRKKGDYRPASYRDVVILLRSTKGWANAVTEELQQAGIPVYADLGSGYFDATEVEVVLSLLRVIDNPRQDIPLAGVLRAPWLGLSAEDLARIRLMLPTGDFYDALMVAAGEEGTGEGFEAVAEMSRPDASLTTRLREFLRSLDRWRDKARRGSLTNLIWDIYQETGYYQYVGGMPGGSQRQANLRALHDRARQYEATSFRGLFRFLRFIERLQESGQDLGAARVLGENEDVVRVMSIHKSKGLEFPVVFVAGLGKRFNLRDLNQRLLLHRSMGLGPELVDPDRCLHYPTLAKLAIRNRLIRELLAEELRILYVAMTRAEEKLILLGTLSISSRLEPDSPDCRPADQPLPDHQLASARRPLDWIIPAVVQAGPRAEGWSVQMGPPRDIFRAATLPIENVDENCSRDTAFSTGMYLSHNVAGEEEESNSGPEPLDVLVFRRLNWRYPFPEQGTRAAKLTVTEAKNRFVEPLSADAATQVPKSLFPLTWERPRFLQEDAGLTAAERGSVMHLVMQHLRLGGALDEEDVKHQLAEMQEGEIITPVQAEAVDTAAIAAFFQTPLGRRMTTARQVYRELPFILGLPADRVYPLMVGGEEETVIVQGIIDCLLDEGDRLVLIDFKTDRLTEGDRDLVKRRYQGQLELYALAVEKIWQRPVGERHLYLFSTGESVQCG